MYKIPKTDDQKQQERRGNNMPTYRKLKPPNMKIYKCPNCGNMLAMGEKCSCKNPVKFVTMLGCKENHLAYIDQTGNIWRVN